MNSSAAGTRVYPEMPYYVKAFAMGIPAVMLGLQISTWIFFLPGALQGHADFRQLYVAGYMLRTGHAHQLFDYAAQKHFQDTLVSQEQIALPFVRPAYQALIFVPFSLFSYRAAYFLFVALNIGLLAISFRMLRPVLSHLAAVWERFPEALFVSFLPIGAALLQGQDSALLLLLVSACLLHLRRGSQAIAGVFLGLALFKFQIVIPIAALFLCWRRWRFSLGFFLSSSILAAVSVCLTGAAQTDLYLRSLFSMGLGLHSSGNELHYPVPMDLMMNLHALVHVLLFGHATPVIIGIITISLSAAVFLFVAIFGLQLDTRGQFLVAVAAAVILSYYIFIHDLLILAVPILVALDLSIFELAQSESRFRLLPAVSILLFVAPTLVAGWAYLLSIPLSLFLYLLLGFLKESRRFNLLDRT